MARPFWVPLMLRPSAEKSAALLLFRLARKVMTSVIRTKTAKIEMLTAGSPMVPASAASTSTTGGLLAARGGVVVGLEALAHLVGDGVGAAPGVPHVQRGDQERRHELTQAHQQSDVDVAE